MQECGFEVNDGEDLVKCQLLRTKG